MLVIAVAHLKGGVGKTTISGYLGHAFAESGLSVLFVDADPQGTLSKWHAETEWHLPCVGMATPALHRQLAGVAGDRFDVVVIDNPPLEQAQGIVVSSLKVATKVVIPMQPTPFDYQEMPRTAKALAEAGELREDGPPSAYILFNRVNLRGKSTQVWRNQLTEDGYHVLKTQIGFREIFSQSGLSPIKKALKTPYGDAALELMEGAA